MAGPSVTAGTAGNAIASGPIAASGSANVTVDFSAGGAFGGLVTLKVTTTTVAATNGFRLDIFPQGDASASFDTYAVATFQASGLSSSSTYQKTLRVDTGVYKVVASNLDATNGITAQVTSSKIS